MSKWEFIRAFQYGEFSVRFYEQERDCDNNHYKVITDSSHWQKSKEFDNEAKATDFYESERQWIKSIYEERSSK